MAFTGTITSSTVVYTGLQGIQGEKGDAGDTGATGPQGPQGETGPPGTTNASEITTGTLAVANGGTGADNAATARSNLGAQAILTSYSEVPGLDDYLDSILATGAANLAAHTGNTSNPHSVTAAQVGAYSTSQIDAFIADLEAGLAARPTIAAGTTNALLRRDASGNLVDSGLSDDGTVLEAGGRLIQFKGSAALGGIHAWIGRVGQHLHLNATSGNYIQLSIGGTTYARLTSAGLLVGSVNNAPQAYLHARGTGTQLRLAYSDTVYETTATDSAGLVKRTTTGHSFDFATAQSATRSFRLLTTSNIGSYLDIFDNSTSTFASAQLRFFDGATTGAVLGFKAGGDSALYLENYLGASSPIYIRPGGVNIKLGVNTTGIGLFGATPVAQSTGWSVAAHSALKSYDPATATTAEIGRVLGTLIDYLKSRGDLAA